MINFGERKELKENHLKRLIHNEYMNYTQLNIMNTMSTKKTILEEAQEIIFQRKEEKERDYGPIHGSFVDTAGIASILTGKQLTPQDCYKVMIALKMSRMGRSFKRDTYVDAVGYMAALAQFEEFQQKTIGKDEEESE
jgi:hypothetical protein